MSEKTPFIFKNYRWLILIEYSRAVRTCQNTKGKKKAVDLPPMKLYNEEGKNIKDSCILEWREFNHYSQIGREASRTPLKAQQESGKREGAGYALCR